MNSEPFALLALCSLIIMVPLHREAAVAAPAEGIAHPATVQAAAVQAASAAGWNLERVKAPVLWGLGHTGEGAVVAILDSGVDLEHPALKGKWRGGGNSWFDPYRHTTTPYDFSGHGTAVAGIMVGGDTSGNPIGMAPGARWIAAKVFDDDGAADISKMHAAFQWVLDPDGDPATDDAPHVVNCSWDLAGTAGVYDPEFQGDIDQLRAAGIVVVFAAGNEGRGTQPDTSTSPGNNPGAFPVGAVDSAGFVLPTSSRGPSPADGGVYPAMAAPAVNIRSSDLYGTYAGFTGTSYAAPHVSGAVALIRSAMPGVSRVQLEEALKNSVAGATGPDSNAGYGVLDVGKAYSYLAVRGDLDGDARITMVDVLVQLNAVVHRERKTPLISRNGDVAPLGVDGKPGGDGEVDLADALLALQKSLGLISW